MTATGWFCPLPTVALQRYAGELVATRAALEGAGLVLEEVIA
jgi:hypothetical protein